MNRSEVLRESQRWLDIISSTEISEDEKRRIITETAENEAGSAGHALRPAHA